MDYILVMTTCASAEEALKIQETLLKKRLVACASALTGLRSRFWWKGKLDSAGEILLFFKTKKRNFREIDREIRRLHSYDCPEITAVPITAGNREYLKWVDRETK